MHTRRLIHFFLLFLLLAVLSPDVGSKVPVPPDCGTIRPSIEERLQNRACPSIFSAWGGPGWSPVLNKPEESGYKHIARHDLWFSSADTVFGLELVPNGDGQSELVIKHEWIPDLHHVTMDRHRFTEYNPNMLFLIELSVRSRSILPEDGGQYLPPDSPHWLRDESGDIIMLDSRTGYINFTQPETQEMLAQQAYTAALCGLWDGVMYDHWSEHWNKLPKSGRLTLEDEIQGRIDIVERIRELAGDDFLIIGNSNRNTIPQTGPYMNGLFMETGFAVYGQAPRPLELMYIENTLMWAEDNLRTPQVNCLEGWSLPTEPLDSPANLALMRLFTTMSLTLSDGFVLFSETRPSGHNSHQHLWYEFWDVDLGQPISETGEKYNNQPAVYIREFDNGWAVYNRSHLARQITLPYEAKSAATGEHNSIHTVPSMDGDIFLRLHPTSVHSRNLLTTSWGELKRN